MNAVLKISSPATREFREIPVLFEDEHLLALDKPAGLLTSPDRYDPQRPNLMKLLHAAIRDGKPWAKDRGLSYLMNAQRLDFETSGVLLLARSKPVLVQLADIFGSGKAAKNYAALAQGAPSEDRFEVNARLGPHPARVGVIRVDSKRGKRSLTAVTVRERFAGFALLQCETRSDRTHQIRAHLQHQGFPLVGDSLYGGRPLWLSRLKPGFRLKPGQAERPLIQRVALHAEALTLPHPVTGETLSIAAPWPKDMKVAVKYLRQFAAAA